MRRKIISVIASFALVCSMVPAPALGQTDTSTDPNAATDTDTYYGEPGVAYAEGEAIVIVKGDADTLRAEAAQANLMDADGATVDFTIDETLATVSATAAADEDDATLLESDDTRDILQISGAETTDLIESLSQLDCVEYAQPNYYYELTDDEATETETTSTTTTATSEATLAEEPTTSGAAGTDEPMYPYQWGLSNTYPGQSENSLHVDEAWSQGAGSDSEVVVAVIDTGVDYTHKDLQASMWDEGLNYPELTALGGGKYGFSTSNPSSDDPMDYYGHGTHCASVIASSWNETGTAGVNGQAKIMAVEFIGATKSRSTTSAAVKCFNYVITAKKCGVNVCETSCSWGPGVYWSAEDRAMDATINEAGENGIISVFSAGNSTIDNDLNATMQRGVNKYIITVGAMQSDGTRADFSDYGQRIVDVFSPGTRILAATTTSDKGAMKPEYVPWGTDVQSDGTLASTTYFMDTNEDGAAQAITYKLYKTDAAGNSILVNDQPYTAVDGGYASDKRACLSLEGLSAGDSFYFEATIDPSVAQSIDLTKSLYLAVVSSIPASCVDSSRLQVECLSKGSWKMATAMTSSDATWSNTSYQFSNVTPEYDRDGSLRLRLAGKATADCGVDSCVYLDDFALGNAITGAYYYSDGTSMACPGVTGTVSLLSSYSARTETLQSAETAAEIAAYVKGGVTETSALASYCNMGGCVNAATSYSAYVAGDESSLRPVSQEITSAGSGTYTLSGYFFGDEQGTLTIDGATAEVVSWSDRSITFKNASVAEHLSDVAVTRTDGKTASCLLNIPAGSYGYTTLSAPTLDIAYSAGTFAAVGGENRRMVAGGDSLFVMGDQPDVKVQYLLRYDTTAATWSQVTLPYPEGYTDISKKRITPADSSLVVSGSTLYVKFKATSTADPEKSTTFIATYDTTANQWVGSPVALDEKCDEAVLAAFRGGLYLLGTITNEETSSRNGVTKIDLATGTTTTCTSLPVTISGGQACEWDGGVVLVADSNTSAVWSELAGSMAYPGSTRPILFYAPDTDTWTQKFQGFNPTTTADAGTTPYTAVDTTYGVGVSATNSGLIITGPVRGNDTNAVVDTWLLTPYNSTVTAVENACFDSARTQFTVSAVCKNTYYVLAYSAITNGLKFASLSLDSIDASAATPSSAISFEQTETSLFTEDTLELSGTVSGPATEMTVESSNEAVAKATYDSATGKLAIQGVSAGTATLTVTPQSSGWFSVNGTATIKVTVKDHSTGCFSDVQDPSAWYYDSVYASVDLGLFSGYDNGTFGPNQSLTRAQAAVVLWRYYAPSEAAAYDKATTENATNMSDVADNQWYTGAANWAFAQGIINGRAQADGSRLFAPNDTITRQELMTIVASCAAHFEGADVEGASDEQLRTRADVSKVSSWAYQSAAWCVQEGVISGKEINGLQYLAPRDQLTRAEMAAIMVNFATR